jgi:dephospho-CoA kinase
MLSLKVEAKQVYLMNADKLLVGLAGMPGSGKSLVVETAIDEGYAVVNMGDIIREETKNRGLELNPKNIGKVMLELRQTGGNSVIAEKCIPKIEQTKTNKIIVDGIRSLSEVDTFKNHFHKFNLIAVHSSPEKRFSRLYLRQRSDDPKEREIFHERDMRELGVGLGNAIAMAEYVVTNEDHKEDTQRKVRGILRRIEKKWMK